MPRGAPDPGAPPCIRQRRLPLTAGDLHGLPERVLAPAGTRQHRTGVTEMFANHLCACAAAEPVYASVRRRCWRKLYQSVDGKTGPVPRTPRCTSGPSRKRVRRDPATRLRRVSSFFAAQTLSFQKLSCPPCGVNARAPRPARNAGDRVMSPTVTECLEHARQCEWYAAGPTMKRTANSFFGGRTNGRSARRKKS